MWIKPFLRDTFAKGYKIWIHNMNYWSSTTRPKSLNWYYIWIKLLAIRWAERRATALAWIKKNTNYIRLVFYVLIQKTRQMQVELAHRDFCILCVCGFLYLFIYGYPVLLLFKFVSVLTIINSRELFSLKRLSPLRIYNSVFAVKIFFIIHYRLTAIQLKDTKTLKLRGVSVLSYNHYE